MTISMAHLCIKTKNLQKTEDFYCGILGLRRVFDFTKNGKKIGLYMEIADRSYIEAFEEEAAPSGTQGAVAHFCLETDDIDGMKKKLEAAGIACSEKKLGCDHTYQIWFQDPNGIDIEFHQYTDKSSQMTGESVEIDW